MNLHLPRFAPAALAFALSCGAGAGAAAPVTVNVSDAAGRPLAEAVVLLEPAAGKAAAKPMLGVELAQAKRQFQPRVTLVTVGTRVNFPNFDTVRHHVYSFSKAKTFEIKLYAGVPAEPVLFDKPGIAVLGCNIHDQMVGWIVVVDTPHFARTPAAPGRAQIDNVPPGAYTLRTWHARLPVGAPAQEQTLTVPPAGGAVATVRLAGLQP